MLLATLSILTLQQAPVQVVQRAYCLGSMLSQPETGCKSWNSHETAGPLYDAKQAVVYIGGTDGRLHVLSSKTGKLQARYELPGNLVSKPVHGEEKLFFGTDQGHLVCFDLKDKEIKWENKIGAEVLSQPFISGKRGYVVSGAGAVYAFDVESGEIIWRRSGVLPNLPLAKPSRPIIAGNKLIWGNAQGSLEFLEISNGEKSFDLTLGDAKKPFPEIVSDPVATMGDQIAVASFNQGVFMIDSKDGVIQWNLPTLVGITSLAYDENILVAAGPGVVAGIDMKSQKNIWNFKFKKGVPNKIYVRDSKVYVGSDLDGLYVLDLLSGRPLQILGVRGGGFAAEFDFSSNNTLFAMSTRGYLFSYAGTEVSSGRRAHEARRSSTHHRALAKQTHGTYLGVSWR